MKQLYKHGNREAYQISDGREFIIEEYAGYYHLYHMVDNKRYPIYQNASYARCYDFICSADERCTECLE